MASGGGHGAPTPRHAARDRRGGVVHGRSRRAGDSAVERLRSGSPARGRARRAAARAEPQGRRTHRVRHPRARARTPRAPRARSDARRPRVLQGLEDGHATPRRRRHRQPVADARARRGSPRPRSGCAAPHRRGRRPSGSGPRSSRGELAQAVVTEPVDDRRLVVEHLLDETLVRARPFTTIVPLPRGARAPRGPSGSTRSWSSRRSTTRSEIEASRAPPPRTPTSRSKSRGRGGRHPLDCRSRRRRRLTRRSCRRPRSRRRSPTCARSGSPDCHLGDSRW